MSVAYIYINAINQNLGKKTLAILHDMPKGIQRRPQQVWFGYSYEETDFSRNFCSLRIWMGWCLCILKQTWPPCPFKIQIATFLTVGSSLKLNKRWIVDSVSYVNFMQDLSTQSCFSCQSRGVFISEFINIFWKKVLFQVKDMSRSQTSRGWFQDDKKNSMCVNL